MSGPIVTPNLLQQMRTAQAPMPALPAAPVMPSAPSLAIPAPPLVTKAPNAVDLAQKRVNDLHQQGSGIDQIHNPLLRGLARSGDIALSVFGALSPVGRVLDATIPGTTLHHQVEIGRAEHNLANAQATQKANADASNIEATAAHTAAETPEVAPNAASTRTLQAATSRHLNDESDNLENPSAVPVPLAQLHANAVQKAIQEGRDPSQDPTVNHLANAIIGLQPGQNKNPVLKESQPIIGADGKPHVYELDEQGNKVKDLGVHYERPMSVNVNAGLGALDRETKQFGTPHQKALESANAQLEKIADARAMINGNAEAQGLGIPKVLTALVGGQGTGVRITQAELQSIAHARGLSGDVEGTLNKWAGKGALSKAQQQQLTQIMDDVKARILQKQTIASNAVDAINGAGTREQIVEADKAARKQLSDLESNAGIPQGHVIQIGGKNYRYKGTGATDDMKNYTEVRP